MVLLVLGLRSQELEAGLDSMARFHAVGAWRGVPGLLFRFFFRLLLRVLWFSFTGGLRDSSKDGVLGRLFRALGRDHHELCSQAHRAG